MSDEESRLGNFSVGRGGGGIKSGGVGGKVGPVDAMKTQGGTQWEDIARDGKIKEEVSLFSVSEATRVTQRDPVVYRRYFTSSFNAQLKTKGLFVKGKFFFLFKLGVLSCLNLDPDTRWHGPLSATFGPKGDHSSYDLNALGVAGRHVGLSLLLKQSFWLLQTCLSVGIGEVADRQVEVLEEDWEDKGGDEACDGKSDPRPDEPWVLDDIGECEGDGGGDGSVEEGKRVDETLHPSGGSSVGELVGGDIDEQLSDGWDTVDGDLEPEGDGGDEGIAVGICASGGVVSAWGSCVDFVLDDSSGDTADSCKNVSDAHSGHRPQGPTDSGHEWVET